MGNKDKREVNRLLTGFYGLDLGTLGLDVGTVMMVIGKTGVGKSSFVDQISRFVLSKEKTVALFCLEETKETRISKIFSMESGVDYYRFRSGFLSCEEWTRLGTTLSKFSSFNFYIEDYQYSLPKIRETSFKIKQTMGLDLVVIDSSQLIKNDNLSFGYSLYADIKRFAKEVGVVVILTSYADSNFSINKYPELDLIVSLQVDVSSKDLSILASVEKNRNGGCIDIHLSFNRSTLTFTELTNSEPKRELESGWQNDNYKELIAMMTKWAESKLSIVEETDDSGLFEDEPTRPNKIN